MIATGLLILGFLIQWPAARGAALALLVAAVFKAFLFDVPHLGGVYLAASLFGLGASARRCWHHAARGSPWDGRRRNAGGLGAARHSGGRSAWAWARRHRWDIAASIAVITFAPAAV